MTRKRIPAASARQSVEVVLTPTTYMPMEAEEISGVSTQSQRMWRIQGHLASTGRHARFDVFSLAHLTMMGLMSPRVGPALAKAMALQCAAGITWHALAWRDSWDGQTSEILTWEDATLSASIAERGRLGRQMLARVRAEGGISEETTTELLTVARSESPWQPQMNWLRNLVFESNGIAPVTSRFFIWWGDATSEFTDAIEPAMALSLFDAKLHGPVMVFDLDALGTMLGERVARPFYYVEIINHRDPYGEYRPSTKSKRKARPC